MEETPVVTVFLRHEGEVLLLRRSDAVGSCVGRWGAVAGHAEDDPDAAARTEIREETGIDPATATTLVRRGDPFAIPDEDLGTRWHVRPYLFDCETRSVDLAEESDRYEWASPTEIHRRETVPALWRSYDRVRPTPETIEGDRTHGSAYLSVRALEVLRDEATLATDGERSADDLRDRAERLATARPAMPVIRTRVDRAVSTAHDRDWPDALVATATEGIDRALAADQGAAATVAALLSADRIATLSRSGTVRRALATCDPSHVLVAESRPGGEGVAVAESLADEGAYAVTLTTDAAVAAELDAWDAKALLVGADAILPDGSVRNKAGTRGAAIAAAHEGIDVVVSAASDKIVADAPASSERLDPGLSDHPGVDVASPVFDRTPAALVDHVATERGSLDATDVAAVAAEHRDLAAWRR